MDQQKDDREVVTLINTLLTSKKLPEDLDIDPDLMNDEKFQELYNGILDLRKLSAALAKGDLQQFAYSKGFILSNLKALQANLRHLTWQTQKVAEGDFSQRVDFLGDFSDSFNEMTVKLHDYTMQLKHWANMDYLTQIPNRRAIMQFLEQSFLMYIREEKPLSVLILDVDHFKLVNDNHGHDIGDQVLIAISRRLRETFRTTDIFCRFGGEEFLAVLPDTTLEGAVCIAERARECIGGEPIKISSDLSLTQTISIGVSQALSTDKNHMELISRCDQALYDAKESGRNRVCIR